MGCSDPVQIGGSDCQHGIFELGERGELSVAQQIWANDDARPGTCQQRLRVQQEASLKLVVLTVMNKHLHRSDRAINEDQCVRSDFATEWNNDIPFVVRYEFACAKEGFGGWHVLAFSVEDAEGVTGVGHALHRMQMSFVDECSAALAASQDVDDPYSAPVEFWQFEHFAMSQVCGLRVGDSFFDIRNQAVQIEVGSDGLLLLDENVASVEAVDFDQQFLNILDVQGKSDRIGGAVVSRIAERKFELDTRLQFTLFVWG